MYIHIYDLCFLYRVKTIITIINCAFSIKKIALVVHVTLVKFNVMHKLNGVNAKIRIKVQNIKAPLKQNLPLFYMDSRYKCCKKY